MADFQVTGELNLENVDQVTAELARTLGKGTAEGMKLAQKFVRDIIRMGTGKNTFFRNSLKDFTSQLKALETRMKAIGRMASSLHVDPGIFAAADENLEGVMRRLHQIDDLMEGTDDRKTRRALQTADLQRRLLTEDMAGIRKLLSLQDTANNAQAQDAKQRSRERMQADRIANAQSIVAQQTSAAQAVASTRAAAQRRVEIIRASIGQIRALERGLGAVFRGTANAISASFSGVGRTITAAISRTRASTTRLDRQFTQGIGGALSRRESTMRSSFSRQERILSSSAIRQSATIARLERVLSGGVLGAATGRGAAAGLGFGGIGAIAGGAGIGALLTSGFQRFSELERLNKQFIALTGSQEQAVALMEEVKAFAKVTPFDLVGVADLAKGFLAIGTNAADVIPQVKTIADAVALTGGGTDELVRIQRAIGQVVSAGRLQGDELNQLAENLPGLNIRKLLADQLTGGDTAALIKMQEAGEISADMFLNGILQGLSTDPRLAGAAEALAGTLSGRFANLKEGFADVGAALIGTIAGPLAAAFGKLQEIFSNLAQFIRGEDLSAALNTLRTAIGGAAAAIGALLIARAAGQAVQILAIAVRALLSPFGIVIAIVGLVGAAIAVLLEHSALLGTTLGRLSDLIGKVFGAIGDAIGTIFGGVEEGLGGATDILKTIGDAIAGFIGDLNSKLAPWIQKTAIPALQSFAELMRDTVLPAVKDGFGAAVEFISNTIIPALGTAFEFIRETVFPAVKEGFGKAVDFIKGTIIPGFQAFISFMGGTVIPFVRDQLVGAFKELQDFISNFDLSALARIGGVLAAALGGFAIAGPVGAAVAGAGAAIGLVFNDSLGASILGGLQNLGGLISGALEGPFNTVKDFLTDFFTADNLLDVFTGFLDIVEKVGEVIGNVLSDPRLIAGLAGLAAAAAATAAKFVQGLIIGIASNLPELYAMLKEAGATALEFLVDALSDPGVLVKAIGALLVGGTLLSLWRSSGQKAGVAAGTGFADGLKQRVTGGALFAGGGAGAIGGAPGAFFESLFFGGAGQLERAAKRAATDAQRAFRNNMRFIAEAGGAEMPPGMTDAQAQRWADQTASVMANTLGPSSSAAIKIRTAMKALFKLDFRGMADIAGGVVPLAKEVGKRFAAGVAGAFAGFQTGKAIAQGGGSILEQFLGVGAVTAAMATISWPAAGAAAAAGVVGIALGNMAKDAQEATARMNELRESFVEFGATGTTEALNALREDIGVKFTDSLRENGAAIKDFLKTGFDIKGFVDDVVAGTGSLRETFTEWARSTGPAGKALVANLKPGMDTLDELRFHFFTNTDASAAWRREIERAGISSGDAWTFIGMVNRAFEEGGATKEDAANINAVAEALGLIPPAADKVVPSVDRVNTAFAKMARATAKLIPFGGVLPQLIDLASAATKIPFAGLVPNVAANAALAETTAELEAIDQAANDARMALNDFFDDPYGGGLQRALNDFVIKVQDLPAQLAEIELLPPSLRTAEGGNLLGDYIDQFEEDLLGGLTSGEIQTTVDVQVKLKQPLIDSVNEAIDRDNVRTPEEEAFLWNFTVALNAITDAPTVQDLIDKIWPDGPPTDLPPTTVNVPLVPNPMLPTGTDANTIYAAWVAGLETARPELPPFEVDVPVTPKFNVDTGTGAGGGGGFNFLTATGAGGKSVQEQLRERIRSGAVGGGGPRGRSFDVGGTAPEIDVPVTIKPDVTVAPLDASVLADIRAKILGGETATGTVSFPVTISPLITVAPLKTDVMGQIRARISGAGGGNIPIAGGLVASAGRTIPFPVTIAPQITVAPTTTDVMGQIRARIFGATGLVGASRSIDFPVTINPQITIGNFAAIVAIGPQIINSIILGIAIGVGALSAAMQRVVSVIAAAAPAARAAGAAVGAGAVQGLIAGSAPAAAAGVSLSQRFAAGIRSGVGAAVSAARAVGAAASANVGTSTSAAFAAGANLANAVASGIRSATGNAVAAARAMANAVAAAARSALVIASPSKLFHKMGVNIGEGMAEGIDVGAVLAVNAATDMATAIANAMTSSFQGASEFFLEAIDEVVKEAGERSQLAAGIPLKNMAARLFEGGTLQSLGEVGGAAFTSGLASLQGLGPKFFSALQQTKLAIEGAHEKLAEQGWLLADEWALLNENWMSVDVFTAAGARNVQAFMGFGEQIRGFVTEALNAGRSLEETLRFAKFFREDLISGALMGGVDMNTINVMLNQLGLSDAALADFVNQVRAATSAVDEHARSAEAAAKAEEGREASEKAAEEAEKQRAREMELLRIAAAGSARPINVMLPYGDPQAAALAVSNRIAYDLSAGI